MATPSWRRRPRSKGPSLISCADCCGHPRSSCGPGGRRDNRSLSDNGATLTVDIPLRIRRRAGRKVMLAPDGTSAWAPPRARVDSALVKAVARAYRWPGMLEQGAYGSITELAAAE